MIAGNFNDNSNGFGQLQNAKIRVNEVAVAVIFFDWPFDIKHNKKSNHCSQWMETTFNGNCHSIEMSYPLNCLRKLIC